MEEPIMNKLPNLPIQIVGRDNVSNLYDLLGSRPLVLALHRFFGCTLSQYGLGNLIRVYRSLENPGFDLVGGVQSYPAYIHSLQDRFDGVPVICDVEGELYKALGLGSAADREELGRNPIVAETVAKAKEAGLVHGEDRAGRSAMAAVEMPLPVCPRWQTQPERPACADCLTHNKKGRETNWFLSLFSQFTGSGHSSR